MSVLQDIRHALQETPPASSVERAMWDICGTLAEWRMQWGQGIAGYDTIAQAIALRDLNKRVLDEHTWPDGATLPWLILVSAVSDPGKRDMALSNSIHGNSADIYLASSTTQSPVSPAQAYALGNLLLDAIPSIEEVDNFGRPIAAVDQEAVAKAVDGAAQWSAQPSAEDEGGADLIDRLGDVVDRVGEAGQDLVQAPRAALTGGLLALGVGLLLFGGRK